MNISIFEKRVLCSLFYEIETEDININYKHGILRSVFILLRTLLFSYPKENYNVKIQSNKTTAITFFNNEHNAIQNVENKISINYHLKLNIQNMFIIRKELGLINLLYELTRFVIFTFDIKGYKYLKKQTYPLLGWLLYKTFVTILSSKNNVRTVTTNMVHPLSLAVFWASISTSHVTDYVEHATTPERVINDRKIIFFGHEYNNFYVNMPHSKQMLISSNIPKEKIKVLFSVKKKNFNKIDNRIIKVGICVNVHDSIESISIITSVLRELNFIYSYRLHDADPRISYFISLSKKENVYLSYANKYEIGVYLKKIDLIIAGNSNVIADAILAGKQSIYYWSGSKEMFDYYGLVKSYDLPNAKDYNSLKIAMDHLLLKNRC